MSTQDLQMVAGSSWRMSITVKRTGVMQVNGALTQTLVPLDLSTMTGIEFCVKKTSLHTAPKMLFKSLVSGITRVDGGVNGVIQVQLDPIDTVKLAPGTYEYDLWLKANEGRIQALRGKFEIVGAVNTDV